MLARLFDVHHNQPFGSDNQVLCLCSKALPPQFWGCLKKGCGYIMGFFIEKN